MQLTASTETPGVARQVQDASAQSGNRPERLAWFQDQALGMFIHWSLDSQLGSMGMNTMIWTADMLQQAYLLNK